MAIKYYTTRPELNDGCVGNGWSATTEGLKEVVMGYSMLPEVVPEVVNMTTVGPIQRGEEKILAEMSGFERQGGEIKQRDEQNMAALAEDTFKEVRNIEADTTNGTDLEGKDGKEPALPTTVGYKYAESSGNTHGRELRATPVTMTRPLLQLAESVQVEKKRLDELENELEKAVTARLEAQSTGPPYTAQILNAMIAENERDIAAVKSALKKRRRLEEREAKLALVGAGLHVQSFLNRDIQSKNEEEKDQKATQQAELPGARPSSRTDAGAFVCDPNWGVLKVMDPIDKGDQEQAVTAELLDEPTQLDFIQAQPPHPEIINSTTRVIMLVVLSYTMLWFYTYWKLSQQIYLAPTVIFVGFRVCMDLLDLYQRVHQFWMCEDPKSIARAMLSKSIVKYVSTIVLTTWYGPCCALCTVWLVPSAIELLDWCSNGYVSFEKWCPRRIRLMQGPFTETTSDHLRTVRLASFGTNTNRISLGILC